MSASGLKPSPERPFIGLRPFGYSDHEYFFGREDQIYSLYRLLDHSRFVAVVGNSGSGKSSLVRAGLLPLLARETAEQRGRSWRWVEMHPGEAPLDNLAAALTVSVGGDGGEDAEIVAVRRDRISHALHESSFGLSKALADTDFDAGDSILVVVDQFEELFRYARVVNDTVARARQREEAAHFVQLLLEASRDRGYSVHVLVTMRSDFIGDCAQFYGLPEAVSASQFLVPATTRDQREEIICRPVEKAGATIDPLLVEQLLNDVSDELDQLPVLQHCLMRLWEHARATAPDLPELTMVDYQAIGRASGALSQHAEEILAGLGSSTMQMAAEQLFRSIALVDDDGRVVRRALPFARLIAETGIEEADIRHVCDRFRADDCSFLVPSAALVPWLDANTPVDVGHEALLRRWDRVGARSSNDIERERGGWLIEENRDRRRYRALLTLAETRVSGHRTTLPSNQVEEWSAWWNARPRTRAWALRYGDDAGFERVRQVISASVADFSEQKARAERQLRRHRLAYVLGALAALAVFGVVTGLYVTTKNVAHTAQIETGILADAITLAEFAMSEDFRLVPHTEASMLNVLNDAQNLSNSYAVYVRQQKYGDHNSAERLRIATKIIKASQLILLGDVTDAMREFDEKDLNRLDPGDDRMNLLKTQFYYYRANAERTGNLLARARKDFTTAIALATQPTTSQGFDQKLVAAQLDEVRGRALRARVDVDVLAGDVNSARADLRVYETYMAKPRLVTDSTDCSAQDFTNIGQSDVEGMARNANVELLAGEYDTAQADYSSYVKTRSDLRKGAGQNGPDANARACHDTKASQEDNFANNRLATQQDHFVNNLLLGNAQVRLAQADLHFGQFDDALVQLKDADLLFDDLIKDDRLNSYAINNDIQTHLTFGEIYLQKQDAGAAKDHFQRALMEATDLNRRDLNNPREWGDMAKANFGLAQSAELMRDRQAALAEYKTAKTDYIKAMESAAKYGEKLDAGFVAKVDTATTRLETDSP